MCYIKLEKHLKVSLPESLDVTFQLFPEFSEEQEIICGWNDEDISYLLTADDQPGGREHQYYWSSMENALRISSSDNKIKILKSGEYQTNSNEKITFKIYKRKQMGDEEIQIQHLISNDFIAYWVLALIVDVGDIFKVNSEIVEILKTAEIIK